MPQIGDVDPISAILSFVFGVVATALAVWTFRQSGYKLKARLYFGAQVGGSVIPGALAEDLLRANGHLTDTEVGQNVVAVEVRNTRRSPVTVSSVRLVHTRKIRQRRSQKLRLRPGFVAPWIPGPALTQTQLPIRLAPFDQDTVAYPLQTLEICAAGWCRVLQRRRVRVRAVLYLGDGKKIKSNAIRLPSRV
ncbi:hypothetical protein [Micromonospora deserti]|uniref:hypothetical protein n=1 Tax=Micromonospora deserti TaxID=2070366 RepID=UPI0011B39EF0|nr:hypothetical protein [Micromonospora deserti]